MWFIRFQRVIIESPIHGRLQNGEFAPNTTFNFSNRVITRIESYKSVNPSENNGYRLVELEEFNYDHIENSQYDLTIIPQQLTGYKTYGKFNVFTSLTPYEIKTGWSKLISKNVTKFDESVLQISNDEEMLQQSEEYEYTDFNVVEQSRFQVGENMTLLGSVPKKYYRVNSIRNDLPDGKQIKTHIFSISDLLSICVQNNVSELNSIREDLVKILNAYNMGSYTIGSVKTITKGGEEFIVEGNFKIPELVYIQDNGNLTRLTIFT